MVQRAGLTDIGKTREENEDAFFLGEGILAVADGMGGHEAGGLAARTAIAKVEKHLGSRWLRPRAQLGTAFAAANRTIRKLSGERDAMGTTLTVATIKNNIAWIGHVGDSRAYLLRAGELSQLTQDHSLVAELVRSGQLTPDKARTHPKRNVITRAVGTHKRVKPDIFAVPVHPGDRLILCTDGLTTGVDDRQIAHLSAPANDLHKSGRKLIAAANQAGGSDNITVVIGEIEQADEVQRRAAPLATILITAILAGLAFWGTAYWLNHNYYLAIVEDRVAIHRGLPGSSLGYKLGRFERMTSIRAKNLPDYYQARLEREMAVGNAKHLSAVLADIKELTRRQ